MCFFLSQSTQSRAGQGRVPQTSFQGLCLLSSSPTNTQTCHGQISTWLWVHMPMATMDDPNASCQSVPISPCPQLLPTQLGESH